MPLVAAFERPRQAAHGDLACTAAMPLAKAQRRNPREVAAELIAALQAEDARSSAGSNRSTSPAPASSTCTCAPRRGSAVVAEILAERRRRSAASRPIAAAPVLVEFVSANPTGPLHVGHAPPGGARRRDLQPARDAGPEGHARVLLQRRRRADRDAGRLGRRRGSRPGAGRCRLAGDRLQRRLHRRHRRRLQGRQDRQGRRPAVHRLRPTRRPRRHPRVRRRLPAPRAGPRPARRSACASTTTTSSRASTPSGRVESTVAAPGRLRQDLRGGRRALAAHHRLRRRQGPRDAQVRRQLHLLRARRRLSPGQVRARLRQGASTSRAATTTARSRGCAPACRRPASACRRTIPTTCCNTMVRVERGGAGGQDLQARRLLRDLARPDRVDQQGRGPLLHAEPQGRHRVHLRHRPGAEAATTRTRSSTSSTRMPASAR